jgi:Mn2+/Fe2+ NRAMP family transporter
MAETEARSGLEPFTPAELPAPPRPIGLRGWVAATGPGVILLGASIGSGEFLLGPAVIVKYGFTLLWIAGVAILLQTLFNTELMRYTMATGEPVLTGFMRTRPRAGFWAWFYVILAFLQQGWPAWAANAAGAIFFLALRRLPQPFDTPIVYFTGVATYILCVILLLFGRRIERTLEILNWILVVLILGGLVVLAVLFVPPHTWVAGIVGYAGYSPAGGEFRFAPAGADWFLLGAFAAFSGAGGFANLCLSNWARDKGYGMGQRAGYIPSAIGGRRLSLAHNGFRFAITDEALSRWRGWWRLVRADQYVIFLGGAFLGMLLPALLYVSFVPFGSDIRGLGVAAELAKAIAAVKGPVFGGAVAMMAAWVLFKTQLDLFDAQTRTITDIIWTGSRRVRSWRGGDVRVVYYTVLGISGLWGVIALGLAQPIFLLQLAANMGGLVLAISALHLLYINTRLLPEPLRPPLWRRLGLVATSFFYGTFVFMWLTSLF